MIYLLGAEEKTNRSEMECSDLGRANISNLQKLKKKPLEKRKITKKNNNQKQIENQSNPARINEQISTKMKDSK